MDGSSNLLNGIKNANKSGHDKVILRASKYVINILECLKRAGYISNFEVKKGKNINLAEVSLITTEKGPKVKEVKRVSKSSRRMYVGIKGIKTIRNGYGSMILSTPKGVLTDKEAKKEQVGGEVICEIW